MEEKNPNFPCPLSQQQYGIYSATERPKGKKKKKKKVNIHYKKQLWGVMAFNSSLIFLRTWFSNKGVESSFTKGRLVIPLFWGFCSGSIVSNSERTLYILMKNI